MRLSTDDIQAALLMMENKKAHLPELPDEEPLTAKDVAEAVRDALFQFTDDRGNLKVRLNTGGHPYGGG